ncbi:MAG: HAD-IA family hydrolase [Candidatus Izemoplasma sp.]|nr:HAD-IA family hydrolase [Candidatus Izemoplasma sp.]
MAKINTIIYDLDGTLVNTNDIIVKSFKATFKKHFPDISLDLETIKKFIGPPLDETLRNYTKDPFIIQEMIDTYRSFYRQYEERGHELYPEVIQTVKQLKAEGYQLAILTSKTRDAAWPSYTETGLSDYFDLFIGWDDVPNPKPHEDAVNTVLVALNNVKQAIMIGDNQGDILAGKNAGIYSAGVAWSFKGSAHLMLVDPDYMLKDMPDIFRILKLIEGEISYGE